MVEIRRIRGPLDDEQLAWLTEIYGPVDTKYRSLAYVRHQFVENPYGWSAHVFAVAEEGAVGHCGVVPFRARFGDHVLTVGKLEALAVAPAYRGQREDGGSVATDILVALYPFAVENGMRVLFGLAPPAVARIHVRAGCRQVPLDAPAYVFVSSRRTFVTQSGSLRRNIAAAALSVVQNATLSGAYAGTRLVTGAWARPREEHPGEADADLARSFADEGSWTVSGSDAWEWYVGSGVLRALEVPGRFGSRALVRIDESDETTVQLVAWRPRREGLLPAILLLGAAAAIARRRSAPTLRFQPWRGSGGDGALARACRLLGFVKRREAELLLYSGDATFGDANVQLTPFFYVTF